MRKFALLSAQGTACSETVLNELEYTFSNRIVMEHRYSIPHPRIDMPDAPISRTWVDVSDNDAC